jgi:hypothetical protein
MNKKPLLHNHQGKYRGFVVMYINPFFGFLGALRLLPRKIIVNEISNSGKVRRMRVPVNVGLTHFNPRVALADGYNRIFKLVRIYL